jgi:chemotaxis protein histidine kinase CheA
MPKVRYDVSGSDPEEATKVRSFESPKPGQYVATVSEINSHDSGGDPDKPGLEIIFEITDAEKKANKKYVGSRLWYYLQLPGHPSFEGFVQQKLDQFLQSVGVATKKKRKGTFDTDKIVGLEVVVVVRGGKNLGGEYRGEVSNVLTYDEDAWAADADEGEDEDEYDEEEEEVEEEEEEVEEEEDDEDEGDEEDEEEEEETDEEDEEEEEEEEEEGEYDEMNLTELRKEAKERDIDPKGMSKEEIIEALEAEDNSEEEDDEEEEEEEEPPARRTRKSPAKRTATRRKSTAKRSPAKRKTTARKSTAKRGGAKRGRGKNYPFK